LEGYNVTIEEEEEDLRNINKAMEVINLITDLDTVKLVGLCLTPTFFSFQGEFYEQT